MTGSNSHVFSVTIQKNGVTLNTFKKTVIYQENAKKWDVFRTALTSIRADVNNFLTEEVAKERQDTKESVKRECSDEESDDASKSTKRQRQK